VAAPVDPRIGPALVVPVTAPPFAGWVEVTKGEIVHLGPEPTGGPAADTYGASGRLVVPAFVNTHCHTSQQLGRGLADDVDLPTWLHDRIWPYGIVLDERDSEISAPLCAIEQIRSGCTLIADPGGRHVDGVAHGLAAAGIRALFGRSTMGDVGVAEVIALLVAVSRGAKQPGADPAVRARALAVVMDGLRPAGRGGPELG
jgi:5-methylthioadenosine/S-adenosylhomocysteine deaminase